VRLAAVRALLVYTWRGSPRGQPLHCLSALSGTHACRNEASFSSLANRLRRIETKLDRLSTSQQANVNADLGEAPPQTSLQPNHPTPQVYLSPQFPAGIASHSTPKDEQRLSFSSRQILRWPGMPAASLPFGAHDWKSIIRESVFDDMANSTPERKAGLPEDWTSTLSIAAIKGLSNAYFNTFGRIYPFIDRDNYSHKTLSMLISEDFGNDIESCLALAVMALGCQGLKAYEEGRYEREDFVPESELLRLVMAQDPPGKAFFEESQRRMPQCSSISDIQVAQYYLAAALYYAQASRPIDQWVMSERAGTNCVIFWTHHLDTADEWTIDMQARVYWSALLVESVVMQELDLPKSRLRDLESVVPLPKFITSPDRRRVTQVKDESYYHYHFLAQIAHRIILLRGRDELFCSDPSIRVAIELRQQLEEWYHNLPATLQSGDADDPDSFSCPAEALAMSLLQTRYRSAIFHLGRPFLYKAIDAPASLTDQEYEMAANAIRCSYNWPLASGPCRRMLSFAPLKFTTCRSFFGTLLTFHALLHSQHAALLDTLPSGRQSASSGMLEYVRNLAPTNKSLQRDYEFLEALFEAPS
jgi:hypothetical protein